MLAYADVWVPHEQAANESCKREALYAPACLWIRSSFSPRDTFAAFSKYIICGTSTPRKLPVLAVYWWCVCVCDCVMCACATGVCVRACFCLLIILLIYRARWAQHLFQNHCGDFATVSSTARWLCGMRTCGLLFAWHLYRRRALLQCCIAMSEQIPRVSLASC
jgi:hypothetical protein